MESHSGTSADEKRMGVGQAECVSSPESASYNDISLNEALAPSVSLVQQPIHRRTFLWGWRKGVCTGIATTALVLLLNIAILGYTRAHYGSDSSGTSLLTSGDCSKVNRVKVGIHLVINILATALLSASNYTMQVLISPTRKEVDKAHARRKWLDIGLPSPRNVSAISKRRLLLWIGLALSSVPLHLVYNSVVVSTFEAYYFHVLVVAPEFLTGAPYGPYFDIGNLDINDPTPASVIDGIRADIADFERLDLADCITAYDRPFLTTRSDVVVVTTTHNTSNSVYLTLSGGNQFLSEGFASWLCTKTPNPTVNIIYGDCLYIPDSLFGATTPEFGQVRFPVDYCLSRPMPSNCSIELYDSLMAVVICFNAVKFLLMIGTLFFVDGSSLVTIGDAIASFLNRPDLTTTGYCLMGRRDVKTWKKSSSPLVPKMYTRRKRMFWIQAVGSGRLWLSCIAIGTCLITVIVLLRQIIANWPETDGGGSGGGASLKAIAAAGFGVVQSQFYWQNGPQGLLNDVFITNLPQLIFSIVYLVYNAMYTAMLTAREWARFARRQSPPRPLRVTFPQGAQCSTFFLQLPVTYGVPLMVMSAVAHWVISQSFFIISVKFIGLDSVNDTISYVVAGYSGLAVIIALILGVVLVLIFGLVGLQRLPATAIPFVGSCSAAISAACHGEADAMEPVSWGAVSNIYTIGHDPREDGQIGHCAFGHDILEDPTEGRYYM
ncbi:hypothetical protein ANO11243_094580 [Dothideomycetidae sp. 11243]|nr:hypothetical protein ANO11243_094580 [fungal sp. No.11243]